MSPPIEGASAPRTRNSTAPLSRPAKAPPWETLGESSIQVRPIANQPGRWFVRHTDGSISAYMRDGAGNFVPTDGRDVIYKPSGETVMLRAARPEATEVEPEWPPCEPLPSRLSPVAPFDFALLPDAFRPWIRDIAERMQCPADFPAVAILVCLSSVVGRQMGIRPKRLDDWTVTPNLWGALIGRPSLLKTPALQETVRVIDGLEAVARELYQREQRDYEAELLVADAQSKESKASIARALKAGDKALAHQHALDAEIRIEAPTRRRYKTHDVTVEKLGELLQDNPRGILIVRDELIGFLRSLDQEGREGSRAFYLEAWNGNGGFSFDRIGRGTVEIEAACVSIVGGIQPGPLSEYLAGIIRGGAGDDGLLQRFQLAVWPDPARTWRNVDRIPDAHARRMASEVFTRLDTLDPRIIAAQGEDAGAMPWLRFASDAQEAFDTWRASLEERLLNGDLHPAMESHLAKYRSLVPSLALLFRLADNSGAGPVDLVSLMRALAWSEYLESHAKRVYQPAAEIDMAAAIELDKRLSSLPSPFTARDVYRHGWRLLDRDATAAALTIL